MENYYANGQVLQLGIKQGVRTVYCFEWNGKGNEQAGEVIKNALAEVLVNYYPLAGRLTIGPAGRLAVDCNGEGAVFVVAEANCTLSELGDMTKPDPERLGKLVYDILGTNSILEMPRLGSGDKVQMRRIYSGLRMNHSMFDGIVLMEFINSWAETAKGLPPSIPPFLDRTVLKSRNPPKVEYSHQELGETEDRSNCTDLHVRIWRTAAVPVSRALAGHGQLHLPPVDLDLGVGHKGRGGDRTGGCCKLQADDESSTFNPACIPVHLSDIV
ncbi:uncharacterized protein J3R85_010129 [Psidium guajava]|nr:uncharacterized protein J3R85_010129 [Psidium guajava]